MILPILFVLVFALFDLGQWELQITQASNAARDGARAGLMAYKTAEGTTASPGGNGFSILLLFQRTSLTASGRSSVNVVTAAPGKARSKERSAPETSSF